MDQPQWMYRPGQTGRSGNRAPLSGLFHYGAAHHPDRVALSDGEVTYSFAQLEIGAQRIAAALRELGVDKADRVAILAEKRSITPMLAAAIWKLGAIYVPLDADSPPARLERIVDQLTPSAMLGGAEKLGRLAERSPSLSFAALARRAMDAAAPRWIDQCPVAEEQTAYIIFTSGSTGAPKGVMISHRSLLDYFYNHNQVLQFTDRSRVFSLSPFHFDVSIEDTLLPLSLGAFVYLFRGIQVGPLIRRLLARERITHLIAVSTLLSLITKDARDIDPAHLPDLEMVMTGAEICDPKIINFWKAAMPRLRVINAYGPTEATIVCLTHAIDEPEPGRQKAYPIGRPLDGVIVKIVSGGAEITRPGEPGELWVAGSQVMSGYFRMPEETDRVVVLCDGARFYRTGDLCCFDESGRVEFLGRLDDEIKLAGRRIHLGEIRQLALSQPQTAAAATGLVSLNGRQQIGLVVVRTDAVESLDSVLAYLSDQVPEYMLPRVVAVAQAPRLGVTGKTDEKKLVALLNEACERHCADRYVFTEEGVFAPVAESGHVSGL